MTKEIQTLRDKLIIQTGKLARQANGAVVVQYGGTVVLVSACISEETKEDLDFVPLTVEYQEKTYAAGKIPAGFFKREGRPSENEILVSRLIDRSLRPLLPKGLLNEVQIMAIVLSSDGENDPDILSIIGASLALEISDIPFSNGVAACRVGYVDNQFIFNPTYVELEKSLLDLVIAANASGIVMLEARSKEVSEDLFIEAVKFGFENIKQILELQKDFVRENTKSKLNLKYKEVNPQLIEKVKQISEDRIITIHQFPDRETRHKNRELLLKELQDILVVHNYTLEEIKNALLEIERRKIREYIITNQKRLDGRGFTDIRPIICEVGVLPRTHGSCLFTRGQTQSLAVTTLGTGEDRQLIEALEGETYKTFMLHYSFPPFSVGETAPVRGPGRREIGHGALAEKAVLAVMPKKEDFPYTIRVVSEILESNGSSSMATVCAASLALMDAGVPIREPVAGIALGLIKEHDKIAILTDINGLEDRFGDMDFKVAGTKNGITAVQLDLKIENVDIEFLKLALRQSKEARLYVLEKMKEVLSYPRSQISVYAPRLERLKINPEKIGELIGPGGRTIKKIINSTGVTIDIGDDGEVMVSGFDLDNFKKAIAMIEAATTDIEIGKIYTAKVKRVVAYGAFCEVFPEREGLIHISELADYFVKNVEDVVKVGEEIKVKVIGMDELGRLNLSRKQALRDETRKKD
ncbi:MAG: polyribonucleotide nucleotidyltransferase [Candidatus Omnitrophica bacterium]|nr:polyribonucleotide nucleotidyltransferase [Candidatus Omnitrophota bacterium]